MSGLSTSAVYLLVEQYNKQGPESVAYKARGSRRHAYLSVEQEKKLLEDLGEKAAHGEILTAAHIRAEVEREVGFSVSDDYLWGLLRRHQWKKKARAPGTPKKTWGPKRALKKLRHAVAKAARQLSDSDKDKPLRLFFEDEGRSHRINNLQHCWSPPGGRVVVGREIIREFSYSFCSVCPETGQSYWCFPSATQG